METKRIAEMFENKYGERMIKISFPFTLEDLEKVRSIPGRKWHGEEKVWSAPIYLETIEKLRQWQFTIDDKLQTFVQKVNARKNEIMVNEIDGLKLKPYPFQNEGVAFVERNNGRALIGDDPGTGKTIQALVYLQLHPELRPALIVCPASLKLNWEREANKWLKDPKTEILSGTKTKRIKGEIVIINYDILMDWLNELKQYKFKFICLDEAQYIKNSSANRTKAAKRLVKTIPKILGTTGTAIENRPSEIFNIANMIDPVLFENKYYFLNRYCNPKFNGFGHTYNGVTHAEELFDLLKRIMIRRKKSDVLKDLPDKTYAFVPMQLRNKMEYQEAERDFIAWLRKEKGLDAAERAKNAETFASIEGLKQLAVKGKLHDCMLWITDFLETDNKLVVFATHKFVIDELMKKFEDVAVKIDGSVSMNQRQTAIDLFQGDDKVRLFVGNIQAAGVGITLTASSNVAFIEYPWSPAQLDQAADRVHRIGQKNAVTVYHLLAKGTIEEKIAELIDKKRRIVDAVLDGKVTDQDSLLIELINSYTQTNGKSH